MYPWLIFSPGHLIPSYSSQFHIEPLWGMVWLMAGWVGGTLSLEKRYLGYRVCCSTVVNSIICQSEAQYFLIRTSTNLTHFIPLRIVFGITIITGATLYAPASATYHSLFTLLHTILTASMACRAFRSVKTFQVDDQSSFLPMTSLIMFNQPPLSEDKKDRETKMGTQEIQQSRSYPVLIISNNLESLGLDEDG